MPIEAFLGDLDRVWPAGADRFGLRVFGSAALFLRTPLRRGTRDLDILHVDLPDFVATTLSRLAGRDSALCGAHGLYVELVGAGIPFLGQPTWHPAGSFRNFDVHALDPVDVAASKLKRFSNRDRDDLRFLIERDVVGHEALLDAVRATLERHRYDARVELLTQYARNFGLVEIELFGEWAPTDLSALLPEPR